MTSRGKSRGESPAWTTAKHCIAVSFCSTHGGGRHAMTLLRESFANPQARRGSVSLFRASSLQIGHIVANSIFEGRRLA
jgi:hypothetical protein